MAFGKRLEIAIKNFINSILKAFWAQSSRQPMPPYERILFIRYGGLGDMFLSLPVFRTTHQRYPGAQVDVLCDTKNVAPLLGTGLARHIDYYEKNLLRIVSLIYRLRKRKYAYICNLIVYPSFTFGLLSRLIGPNSIRSSGDQERYSYFYNRLIDLPPKSDIHMLERLFLLASDITGTERSGIEKSWVEYSQDIKDRAYKLYKNALSHLKTGSENAHVAVINISARLHRHEWPMNKNVQFLRGVLERYHNRLDGWIIFTDPRKPEQAVQLASEFSEKQVTVVPPQNDYRVLVEFLRHVDVLLTPDTSYTHAASAIGTPVLVLMTGENVTTWPPFDVPHQLAVSNDLRNLEDLPVETVLQAFDKLMKTL